MRPAEANSDWADWGSSQTFVGFTTLGPSQVASSKTRRLTIGTIEIEMCGTSISNNSNRFHLRFCYPIGSMYAIYGNIYHQYIPNVSIYTIHGSYGPMGNRFHLRFCYLRPPTKWPKTYSRPGSARMPQKRASARPRRGRSQQGFFGRLGNPQGVSVRHSLRKET